MSMLHHVHGEFRATCFPIILTVLNPHFEILKISSELTMLMKNAVSKQNCMNDSPGRCYNKGSVTFNIQMADALISFPLLFTKKILIVDFFLIMWNFQSILNHQVELSFGKDTLIHCLAPNFPCNSFI